MPQIKTVSVTEFMGLLNMNCTNGCWEWARAISKSGYGIIRVNKKL